MAVFIPVAMMGGTSGVFYTQFGITMLLPWESRSQCLHTLTGTLRAAAETLYR